MAATVLSSRKPKPKVKVPPLSKESRAACERLGVTEFIPDFVRIVQDCFSQIKEIGFYPLSDPEAGDEWMVVDVRVGGTAEKVHREYRACVRRISETIPLPARNFITLNHHRA